MGYSGQAQRFMLELHDGGPHRLPAASACFNTLRLPRYASEQQLRERLGAALVGARGFYETQ